ncbi:MAG: type-F conjugative transfer system secretin TraK [Desulfurococcaceae archaeon]
MLKFRPLGYSSIKQRDEKRFMKLPLVKGVLFAFLFTAINIASEVNAEGLGTFRPTMKPHPSSPAIVCAPGSTDPGCLNVIGLPPGTEIPFSGAEFQGNVPNQNLPFSVRTPFYKPQIDSEVKPQDNNFRHQGSEVKTATNEAVTGTDKVERGQKAEGGIITDFQLVTDVEEPKVIEKIYFRITPEKKYYVQLSSVDVNRVVCPHTIKSVIFSEERGILAEVIGNNLFIKYKVTKVGDKYIFSETPVDMYIVCGNKVYSMVGVPTRIPGVSIYLIDPEQEIRKSAKWQGMPFEKKVTEIIKSVFRGEPPEGSIHRVKNKTYTTNPYVEIIEKESFVLEFEGLEIRVFQITLKENVKESTGSNSTRPLRVKFKDDIILDKNIVERPLAYAVDSLILEKGKSLTAVVIERLRGKRESEGQSLNVKY